MRIDYWRQLDIFDPMKFNAPVVIIGAGALGGWVANVLTKSGVRDLTVYDFDKVEEHNLPNQPYGIVDIGKLKVIALQELVFRNCGFNINICGEAFTKNTLVIPGSIVYICTDTMSSRKEIWDNVIKHNVKIPLMIESRLGAEIGKIYTINPIDPDHIEKYEKTLYSDEEAEESPCTYRSIGTVVVTMAGLAAHKLIKYHKNIDFNSNIEIKEGRERKNSDLFCVRPLLVKTAKF